MIFPKRSEIGLDVVELRSTAEGHAETRHYLVKDENSPVPCSNLAQSL